jgi:hypothetical protein
MLLRHCTGDLDHMRSHASVVLTALTTSSGSGDALQYAAECLRANKNIVLHAVRNGEGALEYASEELKDDDEVVKLAFRNYPTQLAFASARLQDKYLEEF